MKTHTTIGYNMCMRDEKLRPYIAGPLYHHEGLDGSGYPNGVASPNIPLEGQIIRVADEFDAITSKRQYKTHIGTVDTLNILINETKPNPDSGSRFGKINPKPVKALIKVIIDDTEMEIYNLSEYISYLKKETDRLEQIEHYEKKMNNSKKESDKEYYRIGMQQLFVRGENFDNYKDALLEYKKAYDEKNEDLKRLNEELKNMKKLKV